MIVNLKDLGIETRLASTPSMLRALNTVATVVAKNKIAAIDGDPGNGKTTSVRLFRAQSNRATALATMPGRPNPLDLLRQIHRALHGPTHAHRLNRFELQTELLDHVADWGGVLIVDELQNSQVAALQDLVWLYEESDHAFGLVVVGTGVLQAIQEYPQLATRVMGSVTFQPLTGTDLITALQQMDDRLAVTPPASLLRHDNRDCKGNLRRWVQTVAWLDGLDVPAGSVVTDAVFERIGRNLP